MSDEFVKAFSLKFDSNGNPLEPLAENLFLYANGTNSVGSIEPVMFGPTSNVPAVLFDFLTDIGPQLLLALAVFSIPVVLSVKYVYIPVANSVANDMKKSRTKISSIRDFINDN